MDNVFTAQLISRGRAVFFDRGVKFLTKIWKSIEKKMKKGYNYNRLKFCLSLNFYKMEGKRE